MKTFTEDPVETITQPQTVVKSQGTYDALLWLAATLEEEGAQLQTYSFDQHAQGEASAYFNIATRMRNLVNHLTNFGTLENFKHA